MGPILLALFVLMHRSVLELNAVHNYNDLYSTIADGLVPPILFNRL